MAAEAKGAHMDDRFLAMERRNARSMLTVAIVAMFVIGPLALVFVPIFGAIVGPFVSVAGLVALVDAIRVRTRIRALESAS
jgi:hypothetical protein